MFKFWRNDVGRKKAMIEAVAEVLNLTINTGFDKLLANKTKGTFTTLKVKGH